MDVRRSSLGAWGERVAESHLVSEGYEIVERNWRCPEGEIDLVARVGPVWVFVEVKTRTSDAFGMPEEAVDSRKARHLSRAALAYLDQRHELDVDWRVDVIAITATTSRKVLGLEHFEDVVHSEATS